MRARRKAGERAQDPSLDVVEVEKDGNVVSGKSIMALMTLEATCGTVLKVTASGPQAKEVLDELEALVGRKFDIPDEQ